MLPLLAAPSMLPYGGQAAIEGVMMKGTAHAALAVRRRDGRIEVLDREVKSRFPRLVKLPFFRGFFILWDMMTIGMWALRESSHRFERDMEAEEYEKKRAAGTLDAKASAPVASDADKPAQLGAAQIAVMAISFIIAILIFKVLPAVVASGVFSLFGLETSVEGAKASMMLRFDQPPTFGQQLLANTIEGLVKMGIFVGYVWLIGRMAEIRRVFEYHGAEHIVINAYEHDPANQKIDFIQSHSVAHPRCGTSFIVIMILISVIIFTLLDFGLLSLGVPEQNNLPIWWIRWPLRILALPLLAGVSYEIIRAAFRYFKNPLLYPLLRFGMLFQALTTRRPGDDQVEVSLASFNRVRYLTEGIAEPPLRHRSKDGQPLAEPVAAGHS